MELDLNHFLLFFQRNHIFDPVDFFFITLRERVWAISSFCQISKDLAYNKTDLTFLCGLQF